MQKYRTKLGLFFLFVFLIFTLAASLSLNAFLQAARLKLIETGEQYFNKQELQIASIRYAIPNRIILNNISFVDKDTSSGPYLFIVPRMQIHLSLLPFLTRRRIYITMVSFDRPQVDQQKLSRFIKENFEQIVRFIKRLPRQNIRLSVRSAQCGLQGIGELERRLSLDFSLSVNDEQLRGHGSVREDRYSAAPQQGRAKAGKILKGAAMRYVFKGALNLASISIEKLELSKDNFYAQFWGDLDESLFHIKGFTFIDTKFDEEARLTRRPSLLEKMRSWRSNPLKIGIASLNLPSADLYLLDIDCQVKYAFPSFEVVNLSFSLNNNPMSAKGSIAVGDTLALDMKFSSFLTPRGEIKIENLKKAELAVKGEIGKSDFNGDGLLTLDFMKKKAGNTPLQRAEIGLQGLFISWAGLPRLTARSKDVNLYFRTDSNEYRIFLKHFNSHLYQKSPRYSYVEFDSLFYDGVLKGKGRFDTAKMPPQMAIVARLRDVSANKLAGILIHFSKVYGKLFSVMHFTNYPGFDLEGRMFIEKGYIRNFEFFKWLADFFSLPSLKKIDFERTESGYSVNEEGASLNAIRLDSKDVGVSGYFKLGANDSVTSRLSLSFTKGLLSESPKFMPLLKLMDKDIDSLGFDFQLAGNLHRMNFKWLQSDFKSKLQGAIPNFIERKIEREVEAAIEAISLR